MDIYRYITIILDMLNQRVLKPQSFPLSPAKYLEIIYIYPLRRLVEWSSTDNRLLKPYSYLCVGRRGTLVKVSCGKLDEILQESSGWFPHRKSPAPVQVGEGWPNGLWFRLPARYQSPGEHLAGVLVPVCNIAALRQLPPRICNSR